MSTSQTSNSTKRRVISASEVYGVIAGWLKVMEEHRDEINALNVFPVPDGDTGTNMYLTLQSVLEEVRRSPEKTVAGYAKAVKDGSLKGARGNSGVILSQILRGISDVIIESPEIDAKVMARALTTGSIVAYEAVMKPVEGTMLTVSKDMARAARRESRKSKDVIRVLQAVVEEAMASLERTPELLSTLKDAGVVDAGGKGLVIMAESSLATLTGDKTWMEAPVDYVKAPSNVAAVAVATRNAAETDLEYVYCTEFVLKGGNIKIKAFRDDLAKLGGSLLVVGENGVVKTHIHTNEPGLVLAAATARGELTDLKIDNMQEQNITKTQGEMTVEISTPAAGNKPLGVVAVAVGDGIKKILKSLGVDEIVDGGQTMNPSAEDIVKGIERVKADAVIVLPNNKNIILTAHQAEKLTSKRVFVVPTTAITEAFAGMLMFVEDKDPAEITTAMSEAAGTVKTAEITRASRDSNVNKKKIKKGDIIGLAGGNLIAGGKTVGETALTLVKNLMDKDSEIITLIRGKDMPDKEAADLVTKIEAAYPDVEVNVYDGSQPLYPLIIGVE